MTLKTPFFITALLLVAALAVVLPDLELEAGAEEPVQGATMARRAALQKHDMAGAPHAPSAAETKP
jgi:hypothetical protein